MYLTKFINNKLFEKNVKFSRELTTRMITPFFYEFIHDIQTSYPIPRLIPDNHQLSIKTQI